MSDKRQKFEYLHEHIRNGRLTYDNTRYNELGKDGWRLVNKTGSLHIFIRELIESEGQMYIIEVTYPSGGTSYVMKTKDGVQFQPDRSRAERLTKDDAEVWLTTVHEKFPVTRITIQPA